MIYTDERINECPLFADLMREINALHEEYSCPAMPDGGPTTEADGWDNTWGVAFAADAIGDWGGQEDEAAEAAMTQLLIVLDGIDAGKYPFYYPGSDEWEEFKRRAVEIVKSDLASGDAFNRMCDNPELIGF